MTTPLTILTESLLEAFDRSFSLEVTQQSHREFVSEFLQLIEDPYTYCIHPQDYSSLQDSIEMYLEALDEPDATQPLANIEPERRYWACLSAIEEHLCYVLDAERGIGFMRERRFLVRVMSDNIQIRAMEYADDV